MVVGGMVSALPPVRTWMWHNLHTVGGQGVAGNYPAIGSRQGAGGRILYALVQQHFLLMA